MISDYSKVVLATLMLPITAIILVITTDSMTLPERTLLLMELLGALIFMIGFFLFLKRETAWVNG